MNKGSDDPRKKVEVNLNKLSKEEEALMQKSLSKLKSSRAEISLDNCSPRARRKDKSSSKYKDRSDSESSEDEDGNPKPKSKFFKHTEKERHDEKVKKRWEFMSLELIILLFSYFQGRQEKE